MEKGWRALQSSMAPRRRALCGTGRFTLSKWPVVVHWRRIYSMRAVCRAFSPQEPIHMSIDGIYRVFAAVPPLHLGDPSSNALVMREMYLDACSAGASLVAFPELSVTGYSCGDLFEQRALLDASLDALARLRETTREGNGAILIAGVPILNTANSTKRGISALHLNAMARHISSRTGKFPSNRESSTRRRTASASESKSARTSGSWSLPRTGWRSMARSLS